MDIRADNSQRWPRFHGVLGYIVSVLLVVSCACGAVLGRRAQGGDLNVQPGVYMLASATAGAVIMGCITARRGAIDEHREWMLRELRTISIGCDALNSY